MRWFVGVPWWLAPFIAIIVLTVYAVYAVVMLAGMLLLLLARLVLPLLGVAAAEGLSLAGRRFSSYEHAETAVERHENGLEHQQEREAQAAYREQASAVALRGNLQGYRPR